MRQGIKIVAAAGAVALLVAGCGKPASSDKDKTTTGGGKAFNACMVLDTGGVDDHSFNQSSYAGLQAANKKNSNIKISYVSSNSQNDYEPNLTAETNKGCQTVIAVGGLMGTAVAKIAKANPNQKYAEIDAPSSGANVYGLQYNTAQGGFLGGYLAAGMSKTGKVATYGGLNIPPVTIYMDGFWEGVQYYNTQNGKSVQVLGWDEKKQKAGTFAQSFTDQNKGKSISEAFIAQGADVIFPVAGGTGLGSAAAAQASGGKVQVIWVDTDGCVSAAQFCSQFLASVTKGLTSSVNTYTTQAAGGTFPTGSYIGDLSNNGTGLTIDSKTVPSDVTASLAKVKSDIESGAIKITSPSQPSAS